MKGKSYQVTRLRGRQYKGEARYSVLPALNPMDAYSVSLPYENIRRLAENPDLTDSQVTILVDRPENEAIIETIIREGCEKTVPGSRRLTIDYGLLLSRKEEFILDSPPLAGGEVAYGPIQ